LDFFEFVSLMVEGLEELRCQWWISLLEGHLGLAWSFWGLCLESFWTKFLEYGLFFLLVA
jgi:hypothetical protein